MADEIVADATDTGANSDTKSQDQTANKPAEPAVDGNTPPPEDGGQDPKGGQADEDKSSDGDSKTLLESDDDKAATTPADWPDDWRQKLAGGDEKLLKRLERMKSPQDVLKSWRALETKLSSGEVKSTLPDDASEEQIAAYRKENGIPEKPEGYLDKLPNGLVVGEDDKDAVNSFLESAHGKNASPEFVSAALDWYYQRQEDVAAQQVQEDREFRKEAEDALRAEWGNEYRANVNSISAFLDSAPTDDDGNSLKDLLMGARLADGKPLGNHPLALKWLADLATTANPAGFISPGEGTSQTEGVQAEIKKIEDFMRTNRTEYNKDEKMQARLRQLYEAEEKLSARG